MDKLFGSSKPKPKPVETVDINAPTLGETSQKVSSEPSLTCDSWMPVGR